MKYITKKSCSPEMFGVRSRKGFTLIELLVVVLIIGILAAVALPQYQFVVEKSRLSEALTNMATLEKAIDVFLLANPSFSGSVGCGSEADMELDIELGGIIERTGTTCSSQNFQYWDYGGGGNLFEIYRQQKGNNRHYYLQSNRLSSGQWKRTCLYIDDNTGEKICKQLQQQGWDISDEQ